MRMKKSHTNLFYAFVGVLVVGAIVITILLFSGPNKSFEKFTNPKYTFDYYMMKGCGHCEAFEDAGTWDKLTSAVESSKLNVVLNKYDYKTPNGEAHSIKYGVDSFPSFILTKDGSKLKAYEGAREVSSMLSFLQSNVH